MKLSRLFLLSILIICMTATSVSAQAYSKYSITNPEGNTRFYGVDNSKNTKIYAGLHWKFKVTSISFSKDASNTAGIAFSPMKKVTLEFIHYVEEIKDGQKPKQIIKR